jgi:hypothetical protein
VKLESNGQLTAFLLGLMRGFKMKDEYLTSERKRQYGREHYLRLHPNAKKEFIQAVCIECGQPFKFYINQLPQEIQKRILNKTSKFIPLFCDISCQAKFEARQRLDEQSKLFTKRKGVHDGQ